MTILVVGASGATGRLLVEELLTREHTLKIIVRTSSTLPDNFHTHDNLSIVQANVMDLNEVELGDIVRGCDAIASCLGHTLSFQGIYGQPRRLVKDTVKRLCCAVKSNQDEKSVKFVLMNTSGNSNRNLDEKISFAQKCVMGLLRLLLPPHVDNEEAADYFRVDIGQDDNRIGWSAVRPDGLVNEEHVTAYKTYDSPIRSAIFDAGITSRINVAHFMAELITDDITWNKYKGSMPVIYNELNQKQESKEL